MKIFLSVLVLVSSFIIASSAHSNFGLGSLTGDDSEGGADFGAVEGEVVELMTTSLKNLTKSQAIMLDALGLKDEAAVAEQNAKDLESGSITGKDEMQTQIENSQSTNTLILETIKDQRELSEEAKKKFVTGLPPYGVGMASGISGARKAADTLKQMKSNPMNLTKFSTLVYVGKEAPSLLSMFADTTSAIKDFATHNGVEFEVPPGL